MPVRRHYGPTRARGTDGRAPELKRPLWNGHDRLIRRNDLRLVGEYLSSFGIDQYFHPLHVVVSALCVIAERLDACEVLEPDEARGIHQRLVDAEVVRVTVHVRDGFTEGNHLCAQGDEKIPEAIETRSGGCRR